MGKTWKLQLFQQFGRSRPKQRKTLKIAEEISHVLSVCLVTCTNSAGNLEITTFSAFLSEAAQSKGQPRKLQRNPFKRMEMAQAAQSKGKP